MIRRRIVLLASLVVLSSSVRPAMAALEASPFAGAMVPANALILLTGTSTYIRMQTHSVFGLAVGSSMTERIGIEAVLGVGTGKLEVASTAVSMGSTMFLADLRATMRVIGGDDAQLGLVLGGGYTDVNTGLFDLLDETGLGDFMGRLTGVGGLALRAGLSEKLRLKAEVVDRIHVQGIRLNSTTESSEKTQHDIVATVGLTFRLR